MLSNERWLTIFIIGMLGTIALGGGLYLMATGKSEDGKIVLGITTTIIALLVPSPLSKNFTPPDNPAGEDGP